MWRCSLRRVSSGGTSSLHPCGRVRRRLALTAATSLYTDSTELCADSIEAHPYLPYVLAESTYQVDQDKNDASSSPTYSRRGRCRLRRVHPGQNRVYWYVGCVFLHSDVLDTWDGAAILDTKWCVLFTQLTQVPQLVYSWTVRLRCTGRG